MGTNRECGCNGLDFVGYGPNKMCYLLRMRNGCCLLFVASLCTFITAPIVAQERAEQPITGYPPSVYMRPFLACVSDAPCAHTDKFHLDQIPTGCYVLIVTNGDGQGTDEVRSYEVLLNGERVVPTDHSRSVQAVLRTFPGIEPRYAEVKTN